MYVLAPMAPESDASTLPPLTALRTFEAAARHLSFTRAARELCVTRTAVSHQVKQREGHLGVPLFRRGPRQLAHRARPGVGARNARWVRPALHAEVDVHISPTWRFAAGGAPTLRYDRA